MYYSCSCAKRGREVFEVRKTLGHIFSEMIISLKTLYNPSNHHSQPTYYYTCSRCIATGRETFTHGESIAHVFDQEEESITYLRSSSNCISPAIYYKSCICGEKGTETFITSVPLAHSGLWNCSYDQQSMLDTYHKSGECLSYHQSIDEDISSENNLIFKEETDTRCKVVEYKRYYNDERDDFVVIPRT